MSQLGDELMVLVAEALGLPADAFSKFTEERGNVHRGKIIKYPVGADSDQGVGPHFDGGFLTLVSGPVVVWMRWLKRARAAATGVGASRAASAEPGWGVD